MFTTDTPKNETEINMGAEIIKQICLIKRQQLWIDSFKTREYKRRWDMKNQR